MKKITILLFALTIGFTMQSQEIGIIGDALTGWDDDVNMTTTDNVIYTLEDYTFTSGGAKFRQDDAWTNSWGGSDFPAGTANGSSNIPVIAGTYTVTFNLTTLEYNFESNTSYPEIGIIGSAINGGSTDDTDMFTTDGENYFLNAFNVTDGDAHFRQDNTETANWSDSAFPIGVGTQDGAAIAVTANDYNISFNLTTGAYSFDFLDISLIGDFNSWSGDTDLTTTDGENYTLDGFVLDADGGLKFRQNHDWNTSWGDGGGNIALTADTYNVTFVRSTGIYTFTSTTASISGYKLDNSIIIYPTIATTHFQSNKLIKSIEIYDITGSLIKNFKGQFSSGYAFDISELTTATYFVLIESNEGNNIQRLIIK